MLPYGQPPHLSTRRCWQAAAAPRGRVRPTGRSCCPARPAAGNCPPRARASGLRRARGGWRCPSDGSGRLRPEGSPRTEQDGRRTPARGDSDRRRSWSADRSDASPRWGGREPPMGRTWTDDHRGPIPRWRGRLPRWRGPHPPMEWMPTGMAWAPSPDGEDACPGWRGPLPPMERTPTRDGVGPFPRWGGRLLGSSWDPSPDGEDAYRDGVGPFPHREDAYRDGVAPSPNGEHAYRDGVGPIPRWRGRVPGNTGDPTPDGSHAIRRWVRRLPLTASSRPVERNGSNKIKRFSARSAPRRTRAPPRARGPGRTPQRLQAAAVGSRSSGPLPFRDIGPPEPDRHAGGARHAAGDGVAGRIRP